MANEIDAMYLPYNSRYHPIVQRPNCLGTSDSQLNGSLKEVDFVLNEPFLYHCGLFYVHALSSGVCIAKRVFSSEYIEVYFRLLRIS